MSLHMQPLVSESGKVNKIIETSFTLYKVGNILVITTNPLNLAHPL